MTTITDGSAVFVVRDKRMQAMVDMFYPIGSVYISADKTKTKADFPFMQYGTWEEVPANLCLQTGNAREAGTQRSAGLPNITGNFGMQSGKGYGGFHNNYDHTKQSGALFFNERVENSFDWHGYDDAYTLGFDASKSNPIYGASNTVQPPAYMVRAWVRTA